MQAPLRPRWPPPPTSAPGVQAASYGRNLLKDLTLHLVRPRPAHHLFRPWSRVRVASNDHAEPILAEARRIARSRLELRKAAVNQKPEHPADPAQKNHQLKGDNHERRDR